MERSDLEQYATEGNLAAEWLAAMAAFGDLDGRAVVDVGAGNGILGLGALMLGAASVRLIEADPSVAEVAERNAAEVGTEVDVLVHAVQAAGDLGSVGGAVLISNPPWGVQTTGADRPILEAMFISEAEVIHLMHHADAGHVEALAASHGWHSEDVLRAPFRLPLVHAHQRSGRRDTEVLCRRFTRA
ncbi:MAG: METTL5 family protein [Candidatus Poseidoniaceae archaeon]